MVCTQSSYQGHHSQVQGGKCPYITAICDRPDIHRVKLHKDERHYKEAHLPLSAPFYSTCAAETCASCMRRQNFRSWLYRIRPSVNNSRFKPAEGIDPARFGAGADPAHSEVTPNQLRWQPFLVPEQPIDFVHGLTTICMSGRWVCIQFLSQGAWDCTCHFAGN